MEIDFVGRVTRNTHLSIKHGLIPLFEAISNSIDAIEDSEIDAGEIKIIVRRDLESSLIDDEEQRKVAPIEGFEVIDNGIGFTKENYDAFNRSDTQWKARRGGKGIGRFMWLKAFDHVEVSSNYAENGSHKSRSFKFVLSNDPIVDHHLLENGPTHENSTSVYLMGLKPQFAEHINRRIETIAYRIVEHFLEFFVLERIPEILMVDSDEQINLNRIYQDWVADTDKSEFIIDEQPFTLVHFMLEAQSGMSHKLNYCAIRRVVKEKMLDNRLVHNLPRRIRGGDDSQLIYVGYVSSDYLDDNVNPQRTDFITVPDGGIRFLGELVWDEIENSSISACRDYLLPYTAPIAKEKREMIDDFVSEQAPQYRGLLKRRPKVIDEIPPNITSEKLDLELHKQQKLWEVELRETADEIIGQAEIPIESDEETRLKYERFLEEWNENGKAALAKYVIHRRTTLALLEKYIESTSDEGYAFEKTIHELIFPLRRTSDDIDYEQQNLWIIDEKLAFHSYLSSDIPLSKVEAIDSSELDRPDLLIFDNAYAIVEDEPINGVTIFEFKKPMRTDSNPVIQMFRYVRKIRDGKAVTNRKRPITVRDSTPFYCYAVCDLTPSLRDELDDMSLQLTPDNEGYFGFNGKHKAYVEVISFNKLLKDAKQRNRILFEKLNISS